MQSNLYSQKIKLYDNQQKTGFGLKKMTFVPKKQVRTFTDRPIATQRMFIDFSKKLSESQMPLVTAQNIQKCSSKALIKKMMKGVSMESI